MVLMKSILLPYPHCHLLHLKKHSNLEYFKERSKQKRREKVLAIDLLHSNFHIFLHHIHNRIPHALHFKREPTAQLIFHVRLFLANPQPNKTIRHYFTCDPCASDQLPWNISPWQYFSVSLRSLGTTNSDLVSSFPSPENVDEEPSVKVFILFIPAHLLG